MRHERLFTVGELAKKCGVTVRTLQFYDRSGLLTPSRHSDGGRRLYGVDDVLRLQQILFYKGFGFSLEEIRDQMMCVDSAQDFAKMLAKQKNIVEKQIFYLKETVSLMDKTIEEICQNEDIPINMVIAILSATKQGNLFAYVMKSLGQEELKALISTAELNGNQEPDHDWSALLQRLKELHQSGADPLGPEGEKLAADWWENVERLTGGDPNLISTVLKAGQDMSSWPKDAKDTKTAMHEFLSPAMGQYFVRRGMTVPGMEEETK